MSILVDLVYFVDQLYLNLVHKELIMYSGHIHSWGTSWTHDMKPGFQHLSPKSENAFTVGDTWVKHISTGFEYLGQKTEKNALIKLLWTTLYVCFACWFLEHFSGLYQSGDCYLP